MLVSYIANLLLAIFVVGAPLLSLAALLHLHRRSRRGQAMESTPLALWVVIILFVPVFGAFAYFLIKPRAQIQSSMEAQSVERKPPCDESYHAGSN